MQNIFKSLAVLLVFATAVLPAFSAEKKFTVVIDAGHGGKDVGAVDNSAMEKEINLGVALQLGELLKKKAKDIKVVYTRDDDTFVSLQGRATKANQAKGDIFVSIHTNSVDASNKNRANVCGASTYILGTHKDKDNQQVARRENAVMVLENDYKTTYEGFDPNSDESNIIFEMAQKGNLQNSIRLANEVQKGLSDIAERKNRGVHQAGFWVLWATSMPSILVELDFICNPESAKFMTSASGQKKLAESIFRGITNYRAALRSPKFQAEVADENSDADAVIEKAEQHRQITEVAPARTTNTAVAQPRRRRSETARRISAQREIEVAVLEPSVSAKPAVSKKSEMPELLAASETKDEAKPVVVKNKPDAAKKVTAKKEDSFRARLNKKTTIYKIELFSSEEHLRTNNPKFCGLSPISCVKEGGGYRYLYGESSDKNEISKMLETVKRDIPEAKIVRVSKGVIQ